MTLNLIISLGMVIIVPVGLALIGGPGTMVTRRLWPLAALPGAVSLWVPARTALAVGLALPYAAAAACLCGLALARLLRTRSLSPVEVAVLTALVTPVVAATALIANRAGYPLFGFAPVTLRLTVAHFHFAGFAAALTAGLVCASRAGAPSAGGGPSGEGLGVAAALSVPVGTVTVLAGFFTSDWVQLAGAAVLTTGMWLIAWVTWREVRPSAPDRLTRGMFAVSALIVGVTMPLALDWALGQAAGLPHLPLGWMVMTHGLGNALGFAGCGLAAWYRLRSSHTNQPEEGYASVR